MDFCDVLIPNSLVRSVMFFICTVSLTGTPMRRQPFFPRLSKMTSSVFGSLSMRASQAFLETVSKDEMRKRALSRRSCESAQQLSERHASANANKGTTDSLSATG